MSGSNKDRQPIDEFRNNRFATARNFPNTQSHLLGSDPFLYQQIPSAVNIAQSQAGCNCSLPKWVGGHAPWAHAIRR